jgi:Uma2 family endonuclease
VTELLPFNTQPLPAKLRVEDFLLLDEAGAFARYEKTELIDGEVFYMNAQHRPHSYVKSELSYRLRRALEAMESPLYVAIEASVEMPDHSVPEPDILLTTEPRGEGFVPLASVALIVEVADSSLAQDLGRKAALYAREGIAEYWVADVNSRVIHQMCSPADSVYTNRSEIAFGVELVARTIVGLEIATDSL